MAVHGEVTLTFGDGEYAFNISKIGQVLELQDKCGAGIGTIFERLRDGKYFLNDFREVIRLGLIGAGMPPVEALTLTKRYVDERPWKEGVLTASAIIIAAMVGVPEEKVTKKKRRRLKEILTGASAAPSSTESAPR